MPRGDLLVGVVEDRRLHRPVDELVGVAAEELVERVLAGDVDGESASTASRPPPHLAQAGDGAGEGDADRRVELADVDPQLQRVGGDDGEQLAAGEPRLDLAPLLRGVAAAVGRDPRRQLRLAARLQRFAGEALDQLDPAPALEEADRPHAVGDQLGEQVRRLAQGRAPRPGRLVDQRRVPHRDLAPAARRAVVVDQLERRPDQLLGQPDRVGDRRRGEQEARLGAVGARHPPQPPQHVGDVGAEDAAVGVGLVDDDPAEVGEEVAPALVVGQDADVQHVRVGEDEVAAAADRRPLLARRVAVVDRLAQPGRAQRAQLARLVLGQRLGRVEVEGAALGVAGDAVEHRQVEGEALARGGAAGDHQVGDGRRLQRLALVRVEALDAGPLQRFGEAGIERARQRHRARLALLLARLGDDAAVAACRVQRDRPWRLQQALRHRLHPGDDVSRRRQRTRVRTAALFGRLRQHGGIRAVISRMGDAAGDSAPPAASCGRGCGGRRRRRARPGPPRRPSPTRARPPAAAPPTSRPAPRR